MVDRLTEGKQEARWKVNRREGSWMEPIQADFDWPVGCRGMGNRVG